MRVMGIDPGTGITGFGIVEKEGHHLKYIDSGHIKLNAKAPLNLKLHQIHLVLKEKLCALNPQHVAIEEMFYAKNARSASILAHARGACLLTAQMHACDIFEYSALQVKQAVSSYGRADKSQVQSMVMRLLNLQPAQIKSFDQTDALAVAICHLNSFDLQQKIRNAST